MFDQWKLQDFAPGEGVDTGTFAATVDDSDWLHVEVPGDVHSALIAAGRIADPFYDRNESACAWMEEREWWYRAAFDVPADPCQPDERYRLVFHGLDAFVTIWLNGELLGRHGNMFREAVFDVTDKLRFGETNTLALCFDPPLSQVDADHPFVSWGRNEERVVMRKAQFGYGWDWGPRLPTIGIWRPVDLRRERRAVIRGVHFTTLAINHDEDVALVTVKVEVDRFGSQKPVIAHIQLGPDIKQVLMLDGDTSTLSATAYLTIKNPELWWTHDLGHPALYDLQVTLTQDNNQLDQHNSQVGIRTIELDQSPDMTERGTRFFRFVLNGVPIFAKGANWIPADSFVGSIPTDRYEMLLTAARDANMNMLRVWGGGMYEHNAFYALCDRLGLLVWQDFMFACAMYPEDDPLFVAEVEAEARYQVRRLRSHPCLALWCGNNENQWIHDIHHWDQPDNRVSGALYYDRVLPEAVAELDGHTPYWPGSPYGGNDHNSMADGDRHNWDVWHGGAPRRFGEKPVIDRSPAGVSYPRYADDMGRFISEFGMHAAPVRETLERCIPPDQLFHHSPSMDHHNKDNPKNKGDNLMLNVTGLPQDLDEYIDFSMIAQAEGLKFGIEHFRRRKPHCSGTLFWQLNDCWPVLSWSVLDYYGFGKAGYYYARRVYDPVLASFKQTENGGVELWVTNDTLCDIVDTITVRLGTFDAGVVWEEQHAIQVAANNSHVVCRWAHDTIDAGPDRYMSVTSAGPIFLRNRLFFAAIKDLQREPVEPDMQIEPVDAQHLNVHLRSPGYAYFVHLRLPDVAARFSDNYFDMEPGEERMIRVSSSTGPLDPAALTLGWR
ncbi:MAG: glycoside hydrolase family 2 protein [Anaerolineae bacterium]|nr:glycoside hydrolase family 2 protein [Anaerolineae bacterium]